MFVEDFFVHSNRNILENGVRAVVLSYDMNLKIQSIFRKSNFCNIAKVTRTCVHMGEKQFHVPTCLCVHVWACCVIEVEKGKVSGDSGFSDSCLLWAYRKQLASPQMNKIWPAQYSGVALLLWCNI